MNVSPCAGQPADLSMLVNIPRFVTVYYTETPDPSVPKQETENIYKIYARASVEPII